MHALYSIIVLLPFLVSLAGFLSFLRLPRKGTMQRLFIATTFLSSVYFFAEAVFLHFLSDSIWLLHFLIVARFTVPFILVLMIMIIYSRYYQRPKPWYLYLLFVPPLLVGTAYATLAYAAGPYRAAACLHELYNTCQLPTQYYEDSLISACRTLGLVHNLGDMTCYSIGAILFGLWVLRRTGYTISEGCDYQMHGASAPPFHILILTIIQMLVLIFLRVTLGNVFLLSHPGVNTVLLLALSFCMQCMTFAGLCIEYEECTLRQFLCLDPKESLDIESEPEPDVAIEEESGACAVIVTDDKAPDEPSTEDAQARYLIVAQQKVREGLEELMDRQKMFRHSGLKIEEVARLIGTNRYYISRYVNITYGMNFNEYLNHLRVEYSKEYMRINGRQIQDRIAVDCGFISAQSFSRKFKEYEGITPRAWLVQYTSQKENQKE